MPVRQIAMAVAFAMLLGVSACGYTTGPMGPGAAPSTDVNPVTGARGGGNSADTGR